jgi:hypothetical protein
MMSYDGELSGPKVMIAITKEWPMTGAPNWYDYVDVPDSGFPFEYRIGLEETGEYWVLALIDVDPNDVVGPNFDTDPLAIPTAPTDLQAGDNVVNFTFLDPGEWTMDDDDDSADDDDDNDDNDDDNDTTPETTGIHGALTYAGAATGDTVVFGFWEGLPMGPPDYDAQVAVPGDGFPFDYVIETEFTGTYHVVAFLDVDPNDGPSINFQTDPNNWTLNPPDTVIADGQSTELNITLQDP